MVFALFLMAVAGCQTVRQNPDDWVPPGPVEEWIIDEGPRLMRIGDRVGVQMSVGTGGIGSTESNIDEHGKIPLPMLVEPFKIAGMTPSAANVAIAQEYIRQQIYKEIVVNVTNLSAPPPTADVFFIHGEVRNRSGRIPLTPGITLSEAILISGDVTDFASDSIKLTRGDVSQKYSLKAIRNRRIPDPILMNRDVINVPRSFW